MTQTNPEEKKELQVHQKEALQNGEGTREGLYFKPQVDIFESNESLMVVADLPGTSAEDVEIDLRDNLLTLTGVVNTQWGDNWEPLYQEYRSGHFTRQFRLGQQIDQSKITAKMTDGVLRLELPKAERAVPRKIEVT